MKIVLVLISMVSISLTAHSQILIEDNGKSVKTTSRYKTGSDGHELRLVRKVGLGISAAGSLGLMGLNLELNFSPEYSFLGGFGLGDGYQAFSFQVKKVLAGRRFMPFASVGFARWYTIGDGNGSYESSSPSFLAKKFLSDKEKRTGEFAENLIFPSIGIQYVQLDGEWAGSSIYAEVILLADIDDLVIQPTGGLGYIYYF